METAEKVNIYDRNGRPIKIIDPMGYFIQKQYDKNSNIVKETDNSGNLTAYYTRGNDVLINQITDTYNYDAYGILIAKTGVTENNYLYNGEQFDKTTELYYLRARYMEPSTGTFISMNKVNCSLVIIKIYSP